MKNLKKILSFLLVICMLMAVLSLTACGNKDKGDENNENNGQGENNNSANTYSVTILDQDSNPVEGVMIGIMAGSYQSVKTDATGKATFSTDKTYFDAQILSVPKGYEKPANTTLAFPVGSNDITIHITKTAVSTTKVTYTVTVLDQNDNPVSGVTVQLCTDSMCYDAETNENGIATKELDPGVEYSVKIPNPPEGYSAPEGYFATISADETEITVKITRN